jgi:hypothetical protein
MLAHHFADERVLSSARVRLRSHASNAANKSGTALTSQVLASCRHQSRDIKCELRFARNGWRMVALVGANQACVCFRGFGLDLRRPMLMVPR